MPWRSRLRLIQLRLRVYWSAASVPTASQSNQVWMPTTGSVAAASAAPVPTMLRQNRHRPINSGTRKKAIPQTGLKAKRPQTAPPAQSRPRLASTHPHTRMHSDSVGF